MQASFNIRMRAFKLNSAGAGRIVLLFGFLIVCLIAFKSVKGHALDSAAAVQSGISGYCLDAHHNGRAPGTAIDSAGCNGSDAQVWNISGGTIEHDNLCVSVANNAKAAGSPIILDKCAEHPGQVWLGDRGGYENPNSGLCLAVPGSKTGQQLVLGSCAQLSQANESWSAGSKASQSADCNTSEGQKIACAAEQDWSQWQSGTPSHQSLLNAYTDGAPYEAWCADFVSYVYKQAGYPFTGGNSDGWDENIADQVQYLGFTKHDAAGYTPQAGDVAYFDYPGGHVELVIAGGSQPTFIYGNSATIDPTTGNGQMEANTITHQAGLGQVVYYLSP